MKQIISTQNTLIKEIINLKKKSSNRKKKQKCVVEGIKELKLAIKGGYRILKILICKDYINDIDWYKFSLKLNYNIEFIEISNYVYKKIAYGENNIGIVALVETKQKFLENINFKSTNPLVIVAQGIEKPGNIGALLRTADAAQIDAVIVANPKSDFFNPNVIRSSVGCVFTNQIVNESSEKIILWLRKNKIKIYCACLSASEPYHIQNYTKASAIVVGNESEGLTSNWLKASDQNIIIPMQGEADSMNVSVSAAIIIFEAKRQRQFR